MPFLAAVLAWILGWYVLLVGGLISREFMVWCDGHTYLTSMFVTSLSLIAMGVAGLKSDDSSGDSDAC